MLEECIGSKVTVGAENKVKILCGVYSLRSGKSDHLFALLVEFGGKFTYVPVEEIILNRETVKELFGAGKKNKDDTAGIVLHSGDLVAVSRFSDFDYPQIDVKLGRYREYLDGYHYIESSEGGFNYCRLVHRAEE
jgi:hypothetical protein